MKKTLFLLITLLIFSSCEPHKMSSEEAIKEVYYFKDSKSNLCFAGVSKYVYKSGSGIAIACVPCDSVKHLLR